MAAWDRRAGRGFLRRSFDPGRIGRLESLANPLTALRSVRFRLRTAVRLVTGRTMGQEKTRKGRQGKGAEGLGKKAVSCSTE
jgi:hypothetical protein